ncbi:MAG: hypothetical protein ACLFWG_00190 [Longimicrobiales bacterium]
MSPLEWALVGASILLAPLVGSGVAGALRAWAEADVEGGVDESVAAPPPLHPPCRRTTARWDRAVPTPEGPARREVVNGDLIYVLARRGEKILERER